MFNYQDISNKLTKDLNERSRDIISRRFGIGEVKHDGKVELVGKKESLETIGKRYGITRERVRQIEGENIKKLREKLPQYQNVYSSFREKIDSFGGFKREKDYLLSLGDEKFQNEIFFLLAINNSFLRFTENKSLHSFWATDKEHYELTPKRAESFLEILEKEKKPLTPENSLALFPQPISYNLNNFIEISKMVRWNKEGYFGLKDWPEIIPKGIKDKAYLALKKAGEPLHFSEITKRIRGKALVQTVHNEVIKDDRFVLIGRGIYALREWGYSPGEVKDVIIKVISESNTPLSKKEIIEKVLKQRIIKKNTVVQYLGNKEYFSKTENGKYTIV